MNEQTSFHRAVSSLHWIGAVLFLGTLVLGLYMEEMPRSPEKFELIFLHKSLGLAGMGMVLLRLFGRVSTMAPAPLAHYTSLEKRLSKGVQIGLYAALIAFPLSGAFMSFSAGYPVPFFGLFEIAPFWAKSGMMAEFFGEVHEALVPVTIILLVAHIAGAMKHKLIDKDETLARINPL